MTIPISSIVNVLPSVVSAGGNALVLNGMMLTTSFRVPTGTVQSFATLAAVGAFFGVNSNEYAKAAFYFAGFTGASQLPGALLVAQFTPAGAAAWLRSGVVSSLTIPQLAAISGTLSITVDGYTRTAGALSLAAATSYSSAAGLIQTALNATPIVGGVSAATGGVVTSVSTTFTAGISGNVLNVTTTPSSFLAPGAIITVGASAGTQITAQLSGTAGGIGTYAVQNYQTVAAGTSFTATYGLLTLTGSNASGTFSIGQTLSGGTMSAGTQITGLGTGVGAAGTYYVSPAQAVPASTITGSSTPVVVSYDATQGSFFVTSGVLNAVGTSIGYASGTAAASLLMTAATAAVTSQGYIATTPQTAMTLFAGVTQNWASFFTLYDPDNGPTNGPTQKLAFAAWNSAQNNRYAYLAWDADPAPTLSNAATTSFAYQVANTYSYTGVCSIYDPSNLGHDAFLAGSIASLNFSAVNGRTTMAFRGQAGIVAAVTSQVIASNLQANGYNYYGAFATANQAFSFFYPGSISGPFAWLDSYANQIYMNAAFQLNLITLLTAVGSVPYNSVGYAMIEAAVLTTIQQMLNFGAIRVGVTLSSLETVAVNNQAGMVIAPTIQNQGYYFQVQPASAQVRAARTTPTTYFWYADGQSVQQITLNSVEIL